MSLPSVTAVGASILPRVLARRWNSSEGINGSGSSLKYSLRTPETTFTSAVLSLVTASRRSEWDTFSFFYLKSSIKTNKGNFVSLIQPMLNSAQ